MSDEKRVINLNPDFFKISNNKTRKKTTTTNTPIRMKISNVSDKKQRPSSLKRNFLNIIRANQERMIKEKKNTRIDGTDNSDYHLQPPKSEFEESVQFFKELSKAAPASSSANPINVHNKTFKNAYESSHSKQSLASDSSIVNIPLQTLHSAQQEEPIHLVPPTPPYGVLKNGFKPTYRTWKNFTQKENTPVSLPKEVEPSPIQINYEQQLREKIKNLSEMEQRKLLQKQTQYDGEKRKKQKRTIRRTFRVGKSEVHPRISVLVGNKTLRSKTNLKRTQLKETPISEVKRFLRKQGFIKIGTTTPNDVLRQMYENVNMICGEVQNHNPENLLYNYFNDTEEQMPTF